MADWKGIRHGSSWGASSGGRCVADGVAAATGMSGSLIGERVWEHGHAVAAAANDQFSSGQRVSQQVVICDKVLEVGPRFGDTVSGTGELDVGSCQGNAFDNDESQNILIVCSAAIALLRLHHDECVTVDDLQ